MKLKSRIKIKIGIVLSPDKSKIFNNGNYQNAILLKKILESNKKFKVFNVAHKSILEKIPNKNFITFNQAIQKKLDLLICVTNTPTGNLYQSLNKAGIKIVSVCYGNVYATQTSELFGLSQQNKLYSESDENVFIWTSPHYVEQTELIQVQRGTRHKVEICPYVWSPIFINQKIDKNKFYENHKSKKSIAVYEPNLNYTKTLICPAFTIKDYILNNNLHEQQKFYFYGINPNIVSKTVVMDFFNSMPKQMVGRTVLCSREPIEKILTDSAVSLSHQKDNSLNYTTLECLYLGLPVVHNSQHIMAGYRYKGFDVLKASEQLSLAVEHDKQDLKKYAEEAKEEIYKYSVNNKKNVEGYFELITKVMDTKL